MAEIGSEEYLDLQLDVLTEISNIGTGNAVSAISSMLNGKIEIEVPNIRLLKFDVLAEAVGGEEKKMMGILVNLQKELTGMVMFLIDVEAAGILINNLMGRPVDTKIEEFSEMDLSAVNELGNVIAGAYLSAISTLTGLPAATSVPELAVDMAGAILSVPAIEYGKVSDSVLLIQSELKGEGFDVIGNFIFVPTEESFEKVFAVLWD